MQVIRMHDYLRYAPKDAKPNVKALKNIMISFFVAVALAFAVSMFVMGRDIGISAHPTTVHASVHHCACMGNAQR
jgi:hypothetical protein